MARLPRLYVPGHAQLVHAVFSPSYRSHPDAFAPATLDLLLGWLRDQSAYRKVQIHGFSISPAGIALLATPSEVRGLPQVVQSLGRNLAASLRTGSVFAGRYRSTLPEPGQWTLACLVWLERLVQENHPEIDPESWRWSSCATHTGALTPALTWISHHRDYWGLGNTPFDRQARYRARLIDGIGRLQNQQIADALRGQWALGDPAYVSSLATTANRRPLPGRRGRPRKNLHQDEA